MKDASIEIISNSINLGFHFTCGNGYTVSVQKGADPCVNSSSDSTSEIAIMWHNHGVGEPTFCIIPRDILGHVPDKNIPEIIQCVQCEDWGTLESILDCGELNAAPWDTDPWDEKEAADRANA